MPSSDVAVVVAQTCWCDVADVVHVTSAGK